MMEQVLEQIKDFLKVKSEKVGVSLTELEETAKKFCEDGEEYFENYEGEEKVKRVAEFVKKRISAYLIKLERTPTVEVEFLPLFVDKNDWGALRQYIQAKKAWEENQELAIKEGLTNEKGEPLYQNGFRKGDPIVLEEAVTKTYEGFIKTDFGLKKAFFYVRGLMVEKINLELGGIYKFKALKLQKSTDEELHILATDTTIVTNKGRIDYKKIVELLKTTYQNYLTTPTKIAEYYNSRKDETPIRAIVKGSVLNMRETNNKVDMGITIETNNVLEIFDETPEGESKIIVCWVPKTPELDFKFKEDTIEIIVSGILNYREDTNEYQLSRVTGIFYPEQFKKPDTPDISNMEVEEVKEVDEKMKQVEMFIDN